MRDEKNFKTANINMGVVLGHNFKANSRNTVLKLMSIVLRRTVSVTALQRCVLVGDRMHSPIEKRHPLEHICWRSAHNRQCAQMLHLKTTPGTFFKIIFYFCV